MAIFQERFGFTRDRWMSVSPNTSSGTLNDVSTDGLSTIRFTAATSVSGFANGYDGKELEIFNATGANLTIIHQGTGSAAANRIISPTGGNVTLTPDSAARFRYDGTTQRWRFISGAGGGSFNVSGSVQNISAGGTITVAQDGLQTIIVQGNGAPVTTSTTPFGATPPPNGTTIIIVGNNSTNTVTIPYADIANGFWINGDCTLGRGSTLTVQYMSHFLRYVEISRNDIVGV